MSVNNDETGESIPPNDPPSPKSFSSPKVAQLPKGKPKTRCKKAPPKAPPTTPSVTSPSTPTTPESTPNNPDKKPAAKPKIVPYHQYRQDLRKLICFGKICDPKSRQASPTANNTQSWHTKYLLRLHNDLPLLPALERKAIATILSNSAKPTKKLHQTSPNVITVPFKQRLRGGTNW